MENFTRYLRLALVLLLMVMIGCENEEDIILHENQLGEEILQLSATDATTFKGAHSFVGGQATLTYPSESGKATQHFAFNASINGKGSVTGMWESKSLSQNIRTHGTIDCVTFLDDKTAILSGTISQVTKGEGFWPKAEVGESVWFKVIDNDEGMSNNADQFSDYSAGYGGCLQYNVRMRNIESGNIQVKIKSEKYKDKKLKDIEGNSYKTIQIGDQIWMAENLRTTSYNDGTDIINLAENGQWTNTINGAYSWYNHDYNGFGETYGALYNWYAVESGRLAPEGWHVPTIEEWAELVNFVGGQTEGGKLKEIGFEHWGDPNVGATNEVGFSAIGSGYRSTDGIFASMHTETLWWTSTPHEEPHLALSNWLGNDTSFMYVGSGSNKNSGYSIRCIKD